MHQFLPYKKLYKDADLSLVEFELIKFKLENSPKTAKIWVLYLPETSNNQLEIMEARYLRQKYYQKHPLYIVGISKSKEKAIQLVQNIWNDSAASKYGADARNYLVSLMEG